MAGRKSIGKKLRFDIFKRDGFACQYCGQTPPAVVLEVDHIKPVCQDGDNDIDNLITACFDCNRGKGGEGLEISPSTLVEKAERITERQEQLRAYESLLKAKRSYENRRIREIEKIFKSYFSEYSFSKSFKESVRRFLTHLPMPEVKEAMHKACSRIDDQHDAIKYFCGICWKLIKARTNG
tara:strand:- start:3753 stop:4295 length:543 start_codon:yes stop_codon:yes gene_type:complete